MGKIDINDIVGKKFDKLTVLNYVGKEGSNYFEREVLNTYFGDSLSLTPFCSLLLLAKQSWGV